MKIYLAGPINGCTDAEANDWRTAVKKLHPDCLDPMARDYRGKEAKSVNAIVEGDKADIDQCDCVLVYFERPSVGTSMEVLYAWERKKPVVVVNRSGKPISPWLAYHGQVVETIEQAVKQAMALAPTAPANGEPGDGEIAALVRKAMALAQTDYPPEAEVKWLFELPMNDADGKRFKAAITAHQPPTAKREGE